MYPLERSRRLRKSAALRELVRETRLSPTDFLTPLFVIEGKKTREAIPSMPGYERLTLDELEKEVKLLWSMGLKAVLLFVKVDDA
jgi:porphobilinogen synthase